MSFLDDSESLSSLPVSEAVFRLASRTNAPAAGGGGVPSALSALGESDAIEPGAAAAVNRHNTDAALTPGIAGAGVRGRCHILRPVACPAAGHRSGFRRWVVGGRKIVT